MLLRNKGDKMKLTNGLYLSEMGSEFVVMADEPRVFNGVIKLNKSGAFLFELLQKDTSYDDVLQAVLEKYEVDEETAQDDIDEYIEIFDKAGLIEK